MKKKQQIDAKLQEITKGKKDVTTDVTTFNKVLEESVKHLPFDYKKK